MTEFQDRRAAAAAVAAELPPVEVKAPAPVAAKAPAPAVVVAAPAPPAVVAHFKVGQNVIIRKGGAKAVVTKANFVPGKKQSLVECKTKDGSIHEYWFDEIN